MVVIGWVGYAYTISSLGATNGWLKFSAVMGTRCGSVVAWLSRDINTQVMYLH